MDCWECFASSGASAQWVMGGGRCPKVGRQQEDLGGAQLQQVAKRGARGCEDAESG